MKAAQSFTDGPQKRKHFNQIFERNQKQRQTTHNSHIKLDQHFEVDTAKQRQSEQAVPKFKQETQNTFYQDSAKYNTQLVTLEHNDRMMKTYVDNGR
jgi:hypothetical protein